MAEVLEEVDQYLISQYAELRRQTIAYFIVNQPIFGYCEGGERKRGSLPCQFWWEQSIDLDAARAGPTRAVADVAASDEDSVNYVGSE